MTTALDIVTGALQILGVVGNGQVPDTGDANVAFNALNEFLEDLSIDNLAVYTPVDQVFALVPGTASYSIGPTGTWVGFRPSFVDQVRVTYQTIDYEVAYLDNLHFNQIQYKSQTGVLPLWFNFDSDVPNGSISLWPVPTTAMPIYITSNKQLTQIALLSTTIVLPPGYKRMLRYNLAKDLQDTFGKQMSPVALKIADTSLGDIRRANVVPARADFDPALTGVNSNGSRLANLIAGTY